MDGWIDAVVDNYNESYTIRQPRDRCSVMLEHISLVSPSTATCVRAAYIARLRESRCWVPDTRLQFIRIHGVISILFLSGNIARVYIEPTVLISLFHDSRLMIQ